MIRVSKSSRPPENPIADDVEDLDIRDDPNLTPKEKETTIHFSRDSDRATIFTAEGGITRRLLGHPEFEVNHLVTERRCKVENLQQLQADDGAVVGVRGTIPVGALKVSARPRSASGHAAVVSRSGGGS